ncbi:MAG: hypothetical protein IPH35_18940 [Rhodoferax sp.]|nr:hypothetical protein [Rhodoferax sp.]
MGCPTPFGPQGIAVNDQGEIFVADSLGHRVVKWRLLQTGLPVFCKQFSWRKGTDADFTPSDIAYG